MGLCSQRAAGGGERVLQQLAAGFVVQSEQGGSPCPKPQGAREVVGQKGAQSRRGHDHGLDQEEGR